MRRWYSAFLTVLCALLAWAQKGGELRFALHEDPKTFNPVLVQDTASKIVLYLTEGVLVRLNRETQKLQPELATSWQLSKDGRAITFTLRDGVKFSDGTAFGPEDVVHTMSAYMDPNLHSGTADAFRSGVGDVQTKIAGKNSVTISFPARIAGLDRLFDEVAILSAKSPLKEKAVLGPFMFADQKPGSYILLRRNPNYWKRDDKGRQLPYLDSIRLDIITDRQNEVLRFRRGELHLVSTIQPEIYESLHKEAPGAARDLGPSMEGEFLWFNQVPDANLPDYKKAWFKSVNFRRGFSAAIKRADIARLAYWNHAEPAAGPFSRANLFWFNQSLKPFAYDPAAAAQLLQQDGFQRRGQLLYDRENHPVEFSLITNAGNKPRERTASLIQQDVAQFGIKLNVVTLDFPSLIERITKTFDYEACLLGLVNVGLDPNLQMNVFVSSGDNHQWNPNQKVPATPWEAQVDQLMREQASSMDPAKRKAAFDQVEKIIAERQPFIYLVFKNALVAISPRVQNARPAVLYPQAFWNVEYLALRPESAGLHLQP